MKEYYVFEIGQTGEETEEELNELAEAGWNLICSYAYGNKWLIMEREKKISKSCGRKKQ